MASLLCLKLRASVSADAAFAQPNLFRAGLSAISQSVAPSDFLARLWSGTSGRYWPMNATRRHTRDEGAAHRGKHRETA